MNMVLTTSFRLDMIDSFLALQKAYPPLYESLCVADSKLPSWFQLPAMFVNIRGQSSRQRAYHFLAQVEYLNEQDPKEILVAPGVVAASNKTLSQVKHINECKENFKEAVLALKASGISVNDPKITQTLDDHLNQRSPILKSQLQKMGLSRLHLKQCYRKIPILEKRPIKVSWTWANTRAIKRITVEQAHILLSKQKRTASIEQQLIKLNSLPLSEPLAIVQDLAPHLRANLVLPGVDENERMMIKGAVPIFYPYEEGLALPILSAVKDKAPRDENRMIRRDVKLEPEAYLPAIRVHRYQ